MELLSFPWFWKCPGRGLLVPESYEMHWTVIIFMVTVIIFMSLEVGGRGAIGFRIIRNAWDCTHFHGLGSGRLDSESTEMHGTVNIFMVLEVGVKGAAGVRTIRNA